MKDMIVSRALAAAAVLLLAGCAAHGKGIPEKERSAYTPAAARAIVTNRVSVSARGGKASEGVIVRYIDESGGWRGCRLSAKGRVVWETAGRWAKEPDAVGRAVTVTSIDGRSKRFESVMHYHPDTGVVRFRRRHKAGWWLLSSEGWLQERWPQVAVDKCRKLELPDLPVDVRQTGTTLAVLRRQTPDAPLTGLGEPLPSAGSPETATRGPEAASGIEQASAPAPQAPSPEQQLSDVLVGRGEPLPLRWMGEGYADRRFLFTGDGNLVVVDLDGNLAPNEGFEGTWRWTEGRLEVSVAGDAKVHGVAWRELARELGIKPVMARK